MVRKKAISEEQLDIFLKYFVANPSFSASHCKLKGLALKKKRAVQWREISALLNAASVDGCLKTPHQWREYWNNMKYCIRIKADIISKQNPEDSLEDTKRRRISWTQLESQILDVIPLEYFLTPLVEMSACNVDKISSDSSQTSSTPLSVIPSTSPTPSVFPQELPVITQVLSQGKCSPTSTDIAQLLSLSPDRQSPALPLDPPVQTLPLPPETTRVRDSPFDEPELTNTPSSEPVKYPTMFKSHMPALTMPPSPQKMSAPFNPKPKTLPLKVAILTKNISMMPFEEIDLIQKKLQEKIWKFMANPTTSCQPEFESCSKLEPFGLVIKCCNKDALEWLTTTIEGSPFIEHNLIVLLDTTGKLPTTVDMCVELTSDFELNKETNSIFNVLTYTNKFWLDTGKWMLLKDKCLRTMSGASGHPAKLRLVFSVPLSDVPHLRKRGFKLHFLFGVVPVNYYQECKRETPFHEIMIKQKME